MISTKRTSLALAALLFAGAAGATPILYDVNDRGTNITLDGWIAANLDGINGVTFDAVGGVILDDRDRGAGNTDGTGGDTANNDMWRDFVFADERNTEVGNPAGVDISISGLAASAWYDVSLWAFDDVSNGGRNMLWNGVALSIPDSPDPTGLDAQVANFRVFTDATGVAILQGRIDFSDQGVCCNVFVNGFSLTRVPEPGTIALLGMGLIGLAFTRRRKQV
ncbi:PEP-CTERM sorting domain-containing protein [Lentisalinibacter salinarum]|uniref:PEP-CTERM sorting domain-containing protein n=1 Tax=Lentisalinibacter salinarum TaxID=2992239 RepID=UPI00386FB25A